MSPFFYNLPQSGQLTARVSPLVVAAILDGYQRRPVGAPRVLGYLLGRVVGTAVELTDCGVVPHQGTGLDKEYFRNAVAIAKKRARGGAAGEVLVGWFSTGEEIETDWVHALNFFSGEAKFVPSASLPSPVLLVIDPTRGLEEENDGEQGSFDMRCFVANPAPGAEALIVFNQVPTSLLAYQGWADALGLLINESSVLGKGKRQLDGDVESLYNDVSNARDLSVNEETLRDLLKSVQTAEEARKHIIASLATQ